MPTLIRFMQDFADDFNDVGYAYISAMTTDDLRDAVAAAAEYAPTALAMRAYLRKLPRDHAEATRLVAIIDAVNPTIDSPSNN